MLSETEIARDIYIVEKATPSQRTRIPKQLAFEEIVKNNTLSPCSLNEFMDYLVCEESNAELLQFFTWFCHYVERWSELSPREKAPSPPWRHIDPIERGRANLHAHTHRRAGSDRLDQILEILDRRNARDKTKRTPEQLHQKPSSETRSFSPPRTLSGAQFSQLQMAPGQKANPVENTAEKLAKQPFRDEVTKIVDHYMRADAPRRLNISRDDLRECLNAAQTTTHPSSLLPAFTAAETILKSRSHAAFVRKSQRNACRARLVFTKVIGIVMLALGVAVNITLILSSASRFFRLTSLVFWWSGLALLIIASKGICVFLYLRNLRQLRPWEQTQYTGEIEGSKDDENEDELSDDDNKAHESLPKYSKDQSWPRIRGPSSASAGYTIDPLRKASMQVFGKANDWERKARMEAYGTKPIRYKVLDETVTTKNRAIRLLQHRVVLLCFCWAGIMSTLLTVGLLFVPELGIF